MLRWLGLVILMGVAPTAWAVPSKSVFGDFNPIRASWNGYGRYAYNTADIKDFMALAHAYQVKVQARSSYDCDYRSALEAFERFKADTPQKPELWRWWLQNQDAVLTTCGDASQQPALLPLAEASSRAQKEFDYQKLAQAFHAGSKEKEVIEGFRKIGFTHNHPRQRDALRSYIALLARQDGKAAWRVLDTMKMDSATRDVYPLVEDLRFIHLDQSWEATPEERLTQLRWIMGVVQNTDRLQTKLSADMQSSLTGQRVSDAQMHLQRYFIESLTLRGEDGSVDKQRIDWWMKGETQEVSPRLHALRTLIAEGGATGNVLTWMQVNQTYRPSLLMRAYPADEYRRQAAKIARFAYENYRNRKGWEWLPLAVKFTDASQDLYKEIMRDGMQMLQDGQLWNFDPNGQAGLWIALLENRLVEHDAVKAMELLADKRPDQQDLSWQVRPHGVRMEAVEWFLMKGDYAHARQVLALVRPKMYDFTQKSWMDGDLDKDIVADLVVLAHTREELLSALVRAPDLGERRVRQVVSLLPRGVLLELLQKRGEDMTPVSRLYLARMVFMRAWLLNDRKRMMEAAALVNKYAPAGDAALLRAMDGDDVDLLRYMLASPRMRPMATPVTLEDVEKDPLAVDVYNHNDNNWWCGYKPESAREALALAWSRVPEGADGARFAEARAGAMAGHPLMGLVDEEEQSGIAKKVQAPAFLTERVLALQGKSSWWGLRTSPDPRVPEMLHLAVRTTRYGCNSDGSHQSYSFLAFRKLHREYPDSVWTKATPYWFK